MMAEERLTEEKFKEKMEEIRKKLEEELEYGK